MKKTYHRNNLAWFFLGIFVLTHLSCFTTSQSWWQSEEFRRIRLFANKQTLKALKFGYSHGSIDNGIEILNERLARHQRHLGTHLLIARLYLIKGELRDAEEHANIAQKISSRNVQAKLILAQINFAKGKYSLAKLILENLIRKNISNEAKSQIYNVLGGIELKKKNFDLSLKYFKKTIEYSPHDLVSHMNLGMFYLTQKDHLQAKKHFMYLHKRKPKNSIVQLHLGICYAFMRQYHTADKYYQLALKNEPRNPLIYYNLAALELRRNNLNLALKSIKKFIAYSSQKSQSKQQALTIIRSIKLKKVKKLGMTDSELNELIEEIREDQIIYSTDSIRIGDQNEMGSGFIITNFGQSDL